LGFHKKETGLMMMTTCECDLFITFKKKKKNLFSMPTGGVAQYLVDL